MRKRKPKHFRINDKEIYVVNAIIKHTDAYVSSACTSQCRRGRSVLTHHISYTILHKLNNDIPIFTVLYDTQTHVQMQTYSSFMLL